MSRHADGGPGPAGAWEAEYRSRGHFWGGAALSIPETVSGERVLEIGCGNGKTLGLLASMGAEVTAFDISPAAVALARTSVPGCRRLLVADARTLPFRDMVFDTVVAFHILGHMDRRERRQCAVEWSRVLSPGGCLHLRVFSVRDLRCGKGSEVEESSYLRGNGIMTHYFTGGEVQHLFPALTPLRIEEHEWTLRVRGRDHPRSEISAVFEKGC
ncbi:class I SAM-dependent methyltransferase [Methanofollis fontis]|uniref:Class I SAM-dependent methyltransferase n=1 Tax=Methanofollis fontis TaxID=2052832 RepID=A0A483CW63_9EURY|nr:class I SAM-dependent methyltransferase [Methanofollis fontis]TAJ43856.1 class I SAM-dependent methyltransferase [Methanofollis fontis]